MSEPHLFSFVFRDDRGIKRNEDMTREELLEVIQYLAQEQQCTYRAMKEHLQLLKDIDEAEQQRRRASGTRLFSFLRRP